MEPRRCPICGADNECAMAADAGATSCWCYAADISEAAMERVPEPARGRVCICARCAEATAPDQLEDRG